MGPPRRTDPGLLYIFIDTRTDAERDSLRADPTLHPEIVAALVANGYPQDAAPFVGLAIESQETVDRDFGGNWYRARK